MSRRIPVGGDVHAGDEGGGGEGEKEDARDDAAVSRIFCWGVGEVRKVRLGGEAEDVGGDAERCEI